MGSIRKREDTGLLFFDFRYRKDRCREQTALDDSPANRKKLQKILDRIELEIKLGSFEYARFFPGSKLAARFGSGAPAPSAPSAAPIAPAVAAPPAAARPSFSQFAQTWQQESAVAWRRSYQRTVRDIVGKHLEPAFGQRDVGSLSREELLQFRSELAKVKGRKKETLSPRRINAVMNVLGLILNEASDRWKFTTPVYNIKPLRLPKTDVEPFTLEQVRLILERVREDYRDYLLVRFLTGMRTGEADGLKWRYVDFERRQILVRETIVQGIEGEDTKTPGSAREIHMSQIVLEALQRQRARTASLGGYVFCNRAGAPLDHNNFTKRVWYPLLRHLGLKARRPYQMRHTAATLWLAAGENPEWIARQMGHASTEMLFKVYSRFVPNLTRQDGSAFERILTAAFQPAPGEGERHD
jgi:integrase